MSEETAPTPLSSLHTSASEFRFKEITLPTEWIESYRPGGFHPVDLGDTVKNGQYRVIRKLGYGSYSTVWLACDLSHGRYVVLKIASAYSGAVEKELFIYDIISQTEAAVEPFRNLPILFDRFIHHGPNGHHTCMVLEVMGPSAAFLLNDFQIEAERAPQIMGPLLLLQKSIIKQLLFGLHSLHQRGVAHGDVQPGNILASLKDFDSAPEESVMQAEPPLYSGGSSAGRFLATSSGVEARSSGQNQVLNSTQFDSERLGEIFQDELVTPIFQIFAADDTSCKSISMALISDLAPPVPGLSPPIPLAGVFSETASDSRNLGPKEEGAESFASKDNLSATVLRIDGKQDPWSPKMLHVDLSLTSFTEFEPELAFKLSDLGSSFLITNLPIKGNTPIALRPPETVLDLKFDHRIDIWNFGCLIFEFLTMIHMFNITPAPGESRDQSNDEHLLQMHSILGPLPPQLTSKRPRFERYIDADNKVFRSDMSKNEAPKSDDLYTEPTLEQYFSKEKLKGIDEAESAQIVELIRKCLQYLPDDRPTTEELLKDPWIAGIGQK